MPLIAILHSPFCTLEGPHDVLHYYCDLMNLRRGVKLHHHEALLRIQAAGCSIPAFSPEGIILTMSASQWQAYLHLLPGRILHPGGSLQLTPSARVRENLAMS